VTFTPKTFLSGAVLPALSLNEMDGNDDHVREEAAYRVLMAVPLALVPIGSATAPTASVQWKIDGTAYGLAGAAAQGDINISGLTLGIHTLELTATGLGYVGTRFVKTLDLLYLSAWWSAGPVIALAKIPVTDPPQYLWPMRAITVIGHREIRGWA